MDQLEFQIVTIKCDFRRNNMRNVFLVPLFFVLSSCSLFDSARQQLNEMPQEDFDALVTTVGSASLNAGEELGVVLEDETEIVLIQTLVATLRNSVESGNIEVKSNDVVSTLLRYFDVALTDNQLELVEDVARIIDVSVGQINVDIGGDFTEREELLLVTMLNGLYDGLEVERARR